MFGKIDLSPVHVTQSAILVLAFFSIVTDLLWGKIYNWLTLPALLLGLVFSFSTTGLSGLGQGALGVFAAFVLYGWMFGLRFLGGGDVKLLMALGAWGGLSYTEEVAILAIFIGGLFGLVSLAYTGKLTAFCKKIYSSLISLFVPGLEFIPPKIDKTLTMPFGVPISIAAVWIIFWHPFESWGIALWP